MSWLLFWLIAMTLAESQGCLKCSPEAMQVLNEIKGPYLESKLRGDPELRAKLQQLLETNVEGLSWYPPKEGKYMGNIDEVTLQQLAGSFKRSMNRIMENQVDDGQLFNEITWSLQDLKATFEKLQSNFQKVYCFNECAGFYSVNTCQRALKVELKWNGSALLSKCGNGLSPYAASFLDRKPSTNVPVLICQMLKGFMNYLFISCYTCATKTYSCRKTLYCGERKIKVETDDDLILDCALRWHKYSHGVKTYDFYRVVGGKEQKMATTMDSFLVKKEANANDTGKYRCKMLDSTGYSSSQLDFQVTVVPSVGKTTWFQRPHPTLEGPLIMGISSRAPPPQPDWTVWIVIGTTGGLLFIIVAAFVFYYRHQNEKEEGESSDDDDDEEDEDDSESSE